MVASRGQNFGLKIFLYFQNLFAYLFNNWRGKDIHIYIQRERMGEMNE